MGTVDFSVTAGKPMVTHESFVIGMFEPVLLDDETALELAWAYAMFVHFSGDHDFTVREERIFDAEGMECTLGYINPEEKRISIDYRLNPVSKACVLVHEITHMVQDMLGKSPNLVDVWTGSRRLAIHEMVAMRVTHDVMSAIAVDIPNERAIEIGHVDSFVERFGEGLHDDVDRDFKEVSPIVLGAINR